MRPAHWMPMHRAIRQTLITLLLLLMLAGCTANPPATEPPVADAQATAANPELVQVRGELAALSVRVEELEARITALEQAATTANNAPPASTVSTSAPPLLVPTQTPQAAAPQATAVPASSLMPSPTPPGAEPTQTATATPAPTQAPVSDGPTRVNWDAARAHVGSTATVCGPVVATQFAQQSNGQPTFLNVGQAFPAPDRFQVVIWGDQRANFPTPPEDVYRDANICVTGTVEEFRGTVEVTVTGPAAIEIVGE